MSAKFAYRALKKKEVYARCVCHIPSVEKKMHGKKLLPLAHITVKWDGFFKSVIVIKNTWICDFENAKVVRGIIQFLHARTKLAKCC